MGCEKCEAEDGSRVAYFRIGNDKIGWGNVGLIGCKEHVLLAIQKLRGEVRQ